MCGLYVSDKIFKLTQYLQGLQQQINNLEQLPDHERKAIIEGCLADIARISNEVKDASFNIPAHDQRTYGESIKALSNKLQNVRSSFEPKPKFSFKSASKLSTRKVEPTTTQNGSAEVSQDRPQRMLGRQVPDDSARQWSSPSQSKSEIFSNRDGQHITLPPSWSETTTSGTLSMLNRCVVDLRTPTTTGKPFAGLTLKDITKSLILCGHVDGAVHLTNVSESIIVVASRQFRMHDSRKCDVYLLTSSRPIIEDCSSIRFAPMPEVFMAEDDRRIDNRWSLVDDFKWLRSDPSPNWSIFEEPQRIKPQVWRDIVSGDLGTVTEDLLKVVDITI